MLEILAVGHAELLCTTGVLIKLLHYFHHIVRIDLCIWILICVEIDFDHICSFVVIQDFKIACMHHDAQGHNHASQTVRFH